MVIIYFFSNFIMGSTAFNKNQAFPFEYNPYGLFFERSQ